MRLESLSLSLSLNLNWLLRSELCLRRLTFKDLAAVFITDDQYSEAFYVAKLVPTRLSVFDLASDVGVSIAEEEFLVGALVQSEDFHVDLRQRFSSDCMCHLEFTIALKRGNL